MEPLPNPGGGSQRCAERTCLTDARGIDRGLDQRLAVVTRKGGAKDVVVWQTGTASAVVSSMPTQWFRLGRPFG